MAGTLLGRVNTPGSENFCGRRRVVPGMRQIADAHVAEPGLAVVEVAAARDVLHGRPCGAAFAGVPGPWLVPAARPRAWQGQG
ncbi:DUF6207 family protein, partial [Streptomyces violaceus]|uniref:DUF6207 family protein n=1 Tax=Streptomyces violaceus TaxID=1936 RepID=UPI0035F2F266